MAVHPASLSDSRALRVNTPFAAELLSKLIVETLRSLIRLVDLFVHTSLDADTDVARLATKASPNQCG